MNTEESIKDIADLPTRPAGGGERDYVMVQLGDIGQGSTCPRP